MSKRKEIEHEYQVTCAQLGEKVAIKRVLEKEIGDLLSQIHNLRKRYEKLPKDPTEVNLGQAQPIGAGTQSTESGESK